MSGVRVPLRPPLKHIAGVLREGTIPPKALKTRTNTFDTERVPKPWITPDSLKHAELRPLLPSDDERAADPATETPLKLEMVKPADALMTIEPLTARNRIRLVDAREYLGWLPGDRLVIETVPGVVTLTKRPPSERRFRGSAVIMAEGRLPIGAAAVSSLGVSNGGRVLVETDLAENLVRLIALDFVSVVIREAIR